MQPQFVFWTDLILFALEYKKTPTSASPVPVVQCTPQEKREKLSCGNFSSHMCLRLQTAK